MYKPVIVKSAIGLLALASLAAAQMGNINYDLADTNKVNPKTPLTMSATGFYQNITTKQVISAATYFDVNSALWSDATAKKRWFILKPGKKITFRENDDYWDFPDSTIFVKNFSIDTVNGDSTSRILWETRFLVLKKEAADPTKPTVLTDKWFGFSYKWRPDQMDADLVADTGLPASIAWYPTGKGPGKVPVQKKWIFPPRDKCISCHITSSIDSSHGRSVLGFFTAQLNMPSPLTPGINQIEDFFVKGKFQGTKPANYAASHRWYGLKEPLSATVTNEKKARAYIAANCSGCHGDRGMRQGATHGVDLNYDYQLGVERMQFEYKRVGWSYNLDTLPPVEAEDHPTKGVYLVTPGYPQKSAILYRQITRNTAPVDSFFAFDPERNQMPPLATFEANDEAVAVISAWIEAIPQREVSIFGKPRHALLSPTVQGRNLILPPAMNQGNPKVSLAGVDGRVLNLIKTGHGVYLIPAHIPAGLYLVRVGAQTFTRYVF